MDLVLRAGRVIDPQSKRDKQADVLLTNIAYPLDRDESIALEQEPLPDNESTRASALGVDHHLSDRADLLTIEVQNVGT